MTLIERAWYKGGWLKFVLLPLSWLFRGIAAFRKLAYKTGLFTSYRSPLGVLVVGNISVGGTGKTPFVIALVKHLKNKGYRVAVVSRGYGAKKDQNWPFPRLISASTPTVLSGDEPKLIAMAADVDVFIDPNRSRAIRYIEQHLSVDWVISDDGLQHYAMARDIELVLVDAKRGFGNGLLLPAGPLREPTSRLAQVDRVVYNGKRPDGLVEYQLIGELPYAIHAPTERLRGGESVHLLSGIGNPARFEETAVELGLNIVARHWYPDHHEFSDTEFSKFSHDDIVVITEKDAVKCYRLVVTCQLFVLPVTAVLSEQLWHDIDAKIENNPTGRG